MRLRSENRSLALLTALFISQASFALTPDGKLTTQARNALWFMKITKTEIDEADAKPFGLERSIRLLLPLMKLQAADNPANGPIPPLANLQAIQQVIARAKLKNPSLPKIAIADLPPQLVTALRGAGIITAGTRWATPTQMVAWLLNRNVILGLQTELNKLGNPLAEPGLTATRDFWKKVDWATEKLAIAYLGAVPRFQPPGITPPPNTVTRNDLQSPFGTLSPPVGSTNPSTLPDPINGNRLNGPNSDFVPHGGFESPLDRTADNTHGGVVGQAVVQDRFGRRRLVQVNADGTLSGIGSNNGTLNN